jgi:hypothetical protein
MPVQKTFGSPVLFPGMFASLGKKLLRITDIYTAGEQGLWLDIQNLANLYQDAAGTTPAAVGSPVGLIIDKSGNDNHLSQATSSQKPILRQDGGGAYYLEFDGVDDLLSVTFAAALGDCTVVYAGPDELTTLALNVGTEFQLHTGHCYGLLLIDRELTAAELGSTL